MKKVLKVLSWAIPLLFIALMIAGDILEYYGMSKEALMMSGVAAFAFVGLLLQMGISTNRLGWYKTWFALVLTVGVALMAMLSFFKERPAEDSAVIAMLLSEGFLLYFIWDIRESMERVDVEQLALPTSEALSVAVVFSYSFDAETSVYLFDTEEAAKHFLRESFEEEIRIDREENGWEVDAEISEDGMSAYIDCIFEDHSDHTDMRIANIYR